MNEDLKIVDKWAVIIGQTDPSGDPRLHLHRIFDYKYKQAAFDCVKSLKDIYPLMFVQQIKCDAALN